MAPLAAAIPQAAVCRTALLSLSLTLMPDSAAVFVQKEPFDEIELYSRLGRYERTSYEGLRYLMNDYQKMHYLTLPTSRERDEWIRRFWLLLDPTPATQRNERRIEHEERVAAARERYPKDEFPGWDHRGETLIRFGEPDWIAEVPGKLTEAESMMEDFTLKMPGELWHYGRLEMIVPFEEVNLAGECTYYMELKTISRTMSEETLEAGRNIYNTEAWSDLNEWMTYGPGNVSELYFAATDELLTFYSHLEHNRCFHRADLERVPLECYFDFTSFSGGGGKLRTEINIEIPLRELTFELDRSRNRSSLEMKVTAFDVEMHEVVSSTETVDLVMAEAMPRDTRSLIPAQFILTMDPGYYRFGLEIRDRNSKKRGCYRMSRYLEPLGEALSMSDIQFASSVGPAGEAETFVKGALRVVPHPLHAYRKPDPVKFYFEIYGLDTDDEDFGFYSVAYSIEPKRKKRSGPVLKEFGTVISSTFETSAFGSTQHERLEIDTSKLWEGSYRLTVRVTDRRTWETVERTASFSILE